MEETNTYLEVMYPGIIMTESEATRVRDRNPKRDAKKLPLGAFAFRYYDQTSKTVKVDGQPQVVRGKQKNVSKTYYPEGELYSLDDVKRLGPEYRILASNMECNNWPIVVKSRRGNFQPYDCDTVGII